MASAEESKQTRIQMKHVFIAIIGILSTLSFIASIAMITIGYLNPFGTVGLGILGGGCVLYFSTILFLCSGCIWVKNRYYADENNYREKYPQSSSEDLSLLKPALNMTSPAKIEAGFKNEAEVDKIVPLWSVSTVYSSVSSSVSTVPDKTILWQVDDADGALDYDVFSSSLTAMQHTDMKLQEKEKLKWRSNEDINCKSTAESKMKNVEKTKMADSPILHSIVKSFPDIPRQRKPVVMDSVGTSYSSTEKKQLINQQIDGQSKNENIHLQTCKRNNMIDELKPMEVLTSSSALSRHHQTIAEQPKNLYDRKVTYELIKIPSPECKPSLEARKIHSGEKHNQTTERHWSVISAEDSWIHKDSITVLSNAPEAVSKTEKKHRSCEKLHQINHQRAEIPLQNWLPNTRLDQQTVQLPIQMTTSEHINAKGNVKSEARKGF